MVKNKRAAIEMSIGTIVTLVLSVTLLIILIAAVTKIGGITDNVLDQTESQVLDQINKVYGADTKLALAPTSGTVTVRRNKDLQGFKIVIRNLVEGSEGEELTFSYEVSVDENDLGNCGKTKEELESLIIAGKARSEIIALPGETSSSQNVVFEIPDGFPKCTVPYMVKVYRSDDKPYASDAMVVKIS